MSDPSRTDELLLKRLLGNITKEEDNELQALADASEEEREFIARMNPDAFHKELQVLNKVNDDRLDKLMKQKMGHIPGVLEWIPETTWIQRAARPLAVAASLLLIAGFTWWFISASQKRGTIPRTARTAIEATLSCDSVELGLGDMQEGIGYKLGGMRIARMGNEFFINKPPDTATVATGSLDYKLAVAGKTEIQVFFQDGTRAELSPSSGIRVKQKELYCTGQITFEVSHHCETPFVVRTPRQQVTVLGTSFRIRDFSTEDTGAVFCYRGRVKVANPGLDSQTLTASQRVTVRPKSALRVFTGDFPQEQWSSPELLFDFTDLDLDSAMNEIAQWYGISSVRFGPGLDRTTPGALASGRVSRYLSLNNLLDHLKRSDLHFKIQGPTILVTAN